MKDKVTKESISAKAAELSEKLGEPVYPMTFFNGTEDDIVYGFIKEPAFLVKARAMDKVYAGMGFTANLEILEACLIREESDPRLMDEKFKGGQFKLGAAKFAGDLLLLAADQTEKKK